MVRHASLFSQLNALFCRQRFYELVFKHGSERYSKGFSSRDHFVAMLDAPQKSTPSYANVHRLWQMYQDLFHETLEFCALSVGF